MHKPDNSQNHQNHLSPEQRQFVKLENNCTLCGQALAIHYEKDAKKDSVMEEACCDTCRVHTWTREFALQ